MYPFDSYPHGGRKLLGKVIGSNCRHGYGLKFMQITGQTRCAYCDLDFSASYENWLQMALDHVVPKSVCANYGLNRDCDWVEDCSNKVLACASCNGFNNRYKPLLKIVRPVSVDEFFNLRDHIFEERKPSILQRRNEEQQFFNLRAWEKTN